MNTIIDNSLVFNVKDLLGFKYKYPNMTINEYVKHIKSDKLEADRVLPSTIFELCCQTTGIDIILAMSPSRKTEAVFARQMAMFFIRKVRPGMSLAHIGEIIGGRDHATVWHSLHQVLNVIDPINPLDFRREWFVKAKNKIEYYLGRSMDV